MHFVCTCDENASKTIQKRNDTILDQKTSGSTPDGAAQKARIQIKSNRFYLSIRKIIILPPIIFEHLEFHFIVWRRKTVNLVNS